MRMRPEIATTPMPAQTSASMSGPFLVECIIETATWLDRARPLPTVRVLNCYLTERIVWVCGTRGGPSWSTRP